MAKLSLKKTVKISKRRSGRPVEAQQGDLKDQILKSFFEICYEEGIKAGTLQKVAQRSQVAFATVRYHFNIQGQSLSEVALNYLLQHAYQWIEKEINHLRSAPRFDPVDSYIVVMLDWIEKEPIFASYLAYFYYLCTTQIELSFSNQTLVETAQKRVQMLVHEGLGMKIYHYEGNTLKVSEQIHTMVMGGFIIGATSRNPESLKTQKENCRELAAHLLRTKINEG